MSEQELSLINIASAINAEHAECYETWGKGLQHAIKAGELLLQAKALVNHGEWIQWVKNNCTFSERTAQNYMRIYTMRDQLVAKPQHVAGLNYRQAVELLADPQENLSYIEKIKQASNLTHEALIEIEQDLKNDSISLNELPKIIEQLDKLRNEWAELKIKAEYKAGEAINTYNSLKEIKDKKLYRETHETFKDYCQDKWGIENIDEYINIFEQSIEAQP